MVVKININQSIWVYKITMYQIFKTSETYSKFGLILIAISPLIDSQKISDAQVPMERWENIPAPTTSLFSFDLTIKT